MRPLLRLLAFALLAAPAAAQTNEMDTVKAQAHWVKGMPIKTYVGKGFSFQYPAGATFSEGTAFPSGLKGTKLVGPEYRMSGMWPGAEMPVGRQGPGYEILWNSRTLRPGTTLKQAVDAEIKKRVPPGCGEDCDVPSVQRVNLAGQPAYVLDMRCCDCWSYQIYFAHQGKLLTFAFNTSDNDLLDAMSAPLYFLIMNSLRWTR